MTNMNKKINTTILIIICAFAVISCDQNVGKRNVKNNTLLEN